MKKAVLVTGGAGFIGSAVCRLLVGARRYRVINLDRLTYAGSLSSLHEIDQSGDYRFVRGGIGDEDVVGDLLRSEKVGAIVHLAAETHVDRSIDGPEAFVETNVAGTVALLGAALRYWRSLPPTRRAGFRFHHVSTDEIYGDLPFDGSTFTEDSPWAPSSPYAASKAASNHFVHAWRTTYGLPTIISNCSNTYGPYHFPEKLIPLFILNALAGEPLPLYGTGENVRDWLHVDDHARAIATIMEKGQPGETYNVGARQERTNLEVAEAICDELDRRRPLGHGGGRRGLIRFVEDRPGHDRRYAMDPSKIERDLGWTARTDFDSGLARTVDWYLANEWWWRPLRERARAGTRSAAS